VNFANLGNFRERNK